MGTINQTQSNLAFEREGEQQMQFLLLRQPLIMPRKGITHFCSNNWDADQTG